MKEYKIIVNFEDNTIESELKKLVQNDYNSIKLNFEIDKEYDEALFELRYPGGNACQLLIKDNVIIIPKGYLNETGEYGYEISIYTANSKLTNFKTQFFEVREELVKDSEDIINDDRYPILSDLINNVTKIAENVDSFKEEIKNDENLRGPQGETGERGPQGIQGEQGMQGIKGEKGDKGDIGEVDPLVSNLVNYYLKTETYTKDEVKNLINAGSTDVDLTNYALKSEIPVKNSQLQNDSGFITDYIETDPTVPNCVKNISQTDISNWNSKVNVNDIPDVSNFITQLELETFLSEIENLTVKEISVTNQVKMLDIDVGIYKTIFTQSGNVDFYYSNGSYQRINVIAGTFAILIRPTNYGWLLLPGSTTSDSNSIYIGTIGTSSGSSSILVKESQVLLKTNTSSYTPTAQYHPATKKYVDTTIKSKINATFTLDSTTLNINTEA